MSKVAINFKTDKELKEAFYRVVKEMHTTPTSLFNMFMSHTVQNRSITISLPKENTKMTEQEFYEMIDKSLESGLKPMSMEDLKALHQG
ncbi:type II toxin-antitoxin system RelB/DinJ family antitoxin [Phocoenobacter skyensis]|uniref:Addiction module antitoxin, RelB/DinJ family n=1 Tax=Phocoenobacter skyensis TaxID=97481 RepID=A0A1H7VQ83_9PAST|nr:type II toxin-antitoxin system RelB/DinJ family antitoxin [Pasteurella skyensis]MDP8078880.1 type II toxin-antitoxin system RelB/DinJ family antitoxin [Pasteurella skyensis]MDP8084807.1 type II toxin-antitoxin system RelB/DinJ family antitoxin [Pasteurella skyensis]MDP8162350.1 type II toxin-antitoxin system RelB/DinJ family antitoxin [Pasteurella skyensis]MDP8172316.1 type II toxin-antitoxin system RelB/DinJ family antitoxin [Pasteurella skyensis]MDP8177052.1 type II toxin-antitoxin system